MTFLRRCLLASLAIATACCMRAAAEPLVPASPLAPAAGLAPSADLLNEAAAHRALELGFPAVAAEMYQALLGAARDPAQNNQLVLGLCTAYLMDGRVSEAEQTLSRFIGAPNAALRLRAGLVAARQKRFDAARTELNALRQEELPDADRGWFYYLRGVLAEAGGDQRGASASFQQAIETSASSLQRARFTVAEHQARLLLASASERDISEMRRTAEALQGRVTGPSAVSNLAIALNSANRKSEAITVLQTQLQSLPREQRLVHDEWSLLLGLIAGPTDGVGRNALRNLVTSGADRDKQRAALQLLASSSREPARRTEFRAKLDELIASPTPHPLLEELLLFRAYISLNDRTEGQASLTRAEADATQVLQQYPGSQFKALAYGILTNAAWERGQYRNAASLASRARESLPPGELRAQAGVLVAEAYFRGNDYVSAAGAYEAALAELPTGVRAGDLMFQQIYSEIRASRLDEAAKLLDRYSRDARFDPINRWQAEWNLTRALQASGQVAVAYGRLNQLLADASAFAAIPPELRARMRWLQARLSYDAGEPNRTLALTQELLGDLSNLEEALRAEIASTTILLQVQATFSLHEENATERTTELLRRLRAEYPSTDAAAYSYIVEADAASRKGRLVDAQTLLTDMAQRFPKSPYAPFALYQAAQYAERRAQDPYYREANNLLEDLVRKHGNSELVFYARLQQGHLLRKLGEYGRAQQVYADLDNNPRFANHPGRVAAQLALADTHAAQAADDVAHMEEAHRIYERLLDLPTVSADVRAEAGYKYGLSLLNRRNQPENALRVWGSVLGLITQGDRKPTSFGAEGRFWLARTVLDVGELLMRNGRVDQARETYQLILKTGLPGAGAAQEALNRLQPAPLK